VRVRVLTGETDPSARKLAEVEGARLDEHTERASGSTLAFVLPAKSFAAVEVGMAGG
jgi:hypothetical protein